MQHDTKRITVPATTASAIRKEVSLKRLSGVISHVVLFINGTVPTEPINISIKNDRNELLLADTSYKDLLLSTGNTYQDRLRPIGSIKDDELTITITPLEALANDFDIQIQFYYETVFQTQLREKVEKEQATTCLTK